MATRRLLALLAALAVLAVARRDAEAVPLRRAVRVSMKAIVNSVESSPGSTCVVAGEIAPLGKTESWVTFGAAAVGVETAWRGTAREIQCGSGSRGEAASDPPFLLVALSAVATRLPERMLSVDLSLSLRKLSGFRPDGVPLYEQSSQRRSLVFAKGGEGETYIPLFVANDTEREAFGLREILLRLDARVARPEPAVRYGVVSLVSLISGMTGAEILLDGGVVGSVAPGGETVLPNVRVGAREIVVRDASGRQMRRLVRVEEDRTVLVSVDPADGVKVPKPYGLVSVGKNARGREEYRRARDGAVVVSIPAGDFLMGNQETERRPLEHRVYVSGFLIDKTAVSWGQYKKFAAANIMALPPDEPFWGIHDDHPAVFVTWEEAKAYCEWVGGRLPTEAEREKACRGTDERKYPWGNEEPDPERAVYRRAWGFAATDPVGAHPKGASPYGLLDTGGNVWEWCADWYDEKYYAVSPARDPRGPSSGQAHVVRGGSWDSRPSVLSCSCRNWGYRGYREGDFGFRCAMDAQ